MTRIETCEERNARVGKEEQLSCLTFAFTFLASASYAVAVWQVYIPYNQEIASALDIDSGNELSLVSLVFVGIIGLYGIGFFSAAYVGGWFYINKILFLAIVIIAGALAFPAAAITVAGILGALLAALLFGIFQAVCCIKNWFCE